MANSGMSVSILTGLGRWRKRVMKLMCSGTVITMRDRTAIVLFVAGGFCEAGGLTSKPHRRSGTEIGEG